MSRNNIIFAFNVIVLKCTKENSIKYEKVS